jgi:diketogulonate reductase-like aldo/keto reductase
MKFTLHNGIEIPAVGLGTWKSKSKEAYNAVRFALDAGYRHIDTAMIYGNEVEIGKAIKDSNVAREDIFLTSKLWNTDQGYQETLDACNKSLNNLGVEYLDLYLIHWFKGYDKQLETYRAMETLYKEGKVKAIGVSNHNIHHIQHLLEHCEIPPMVNQVEMHIGLQNHFLQEYCVKNNIQMEAYAPLMSWKIQDLLSNEEMIKIAKKHDRTVPQIAIRWLMQRGIVVLPKSINKDRIESNFNVFDFSLDELDMASIRKQNNGTKLFPEFDNIDY